MEGSRITLQEVRKLHLRKLFADNPTQGERLTASAAGIELDYSKNRITDETLALLFLLAKDAGLRERIDAMFSGSKINITENRAVLHTNETSVSQYMVRRRRPPSQTWKTFLENHVKSMVSVDFLSECLLPGRISDRPAQEHRSERLRKLIGGPLPDP